jgi:hypothetical protein
MVLTPIQISNGPLKVISNIEPLPIHHIAQNVRIGIRFCVDNLDNLLYFPPHFVTSELNWLRSIVDQKSISNIGDFDE